MILEPAFVPCRWGMKTVLPVVGGLPARGRGRGGHCGAAGVRPQPLRPHRTRPLPRRCAPAPGARPSLSRAWAAHAGLLITAAFLEILLYTAEAGVIAQCIVHMHAGPCWIAAPFVETLLNVAKRPVSEVPNRHHFTLNSKYSTYF